MNGSGIGVNRRSPLTQQGASKEVKVLRNGSVAVREGLVGRRDGRKGLIGTTALCKKRWSEDVAAELQQEKGTTGAWQC